MVKSGAPNNEFEEVERDILRAFGWAIVEFEETLYHKYLMMSVPHSLITREEFDRHLREMHAKGFISPLKLHGCNAWKKLVVEDDFDDTLKPRKIMVAETSLPKKEAKHKGFVVSESQIIAQDIVRTMKNKLFPGRPDNPQIRSTFREHAARMRRALTQSRNEFMEYLKKEAPTLTKPMELILSSKGENLLLLSLRLIENDSV